MAELPRPAGPPMLPRMIRVVIQWFSRPPWLDAAVLACLVIIFWAGVRLTDRVLTHDGIARLPATQPDLCRVVAVRADNLDGNFCTEDWLLFANSFSDPGRLHALRVSDGQKRTIHLEQNQFRGVAAGLESGSIIAHTIDGEEFTDEWTHHCLNEVGAPGIPLQSSGTGPNGNRPLVPLYGEGQTFSFTKYGIDRPMTFSVKLPHGHRLLSFDPERLNALSYPPGESGDWLGPEVREVHCWNIRQPPLRPTLRWSRPTRRNVIDARGWVRDEPMIVFSEGDSDAIVVINIADGRVVARVPDHPGTPVRITSAGRLVVGYPTLLTWDPTRRSWLPFPVSGLFTFDQKFQIRTADPRFEFCVYLFDWNDKTPLPSTNIRVPGWTYTSQGRSVAQLAGDRIVLVDAHRGLEVRLFDTATGELLATVAPFATYGPLAVTLGAMWTAGWIVVVARSRRRLAFGWVALVVLLTSVVFSHLLRQRIEHWAPTHLPETHVVLLSSVIATAIVSAALRSSLTLADRIGLICLSFGPPLLLSHYLGGVFEYVERGGIYIPLAGLVALLVRWGLRRNWSHRLEMNRSTTLALGRLTFAAGIMMASLRPVVGEEGFEALYWMFRNTDPTPTFLYTAAFLAWGSMLPISQVVAGLGIGIPYAVLFGGIGFWLHRFEPLPPWWLNNIDSLMLVALVSTAIGLTLPAVHPPMEEETGHDKGQMGVEGLEPPTTSV